MVGLSKTKSELGSLQDALAKTQVELEKTNFELHAKKSKHLSLVSSSVPGMHQYTALNSCANYVCWCRHRHCLQHGSCHVKSTVPLDHAVDWP